VIEVYDGWIQAAFLPTTDSVTVITCLVDTESRVSETLNQ